MGAASVTHCRLVCPGWYRYALLECLQEYSAYLVIICIRWDSEYDRLPGPRRMFCPGRQRDLCEEHGAGYRDQIATDHYCPSPVHSIVPHDASCPDPVISVYSQQ